MADVRKRTGSKGTTYQVRYQSKEVKSGYAYATFDTLKAARAFTENLGSLNTAPGGVALTVPQAVDRWLDICEKIGRDGREKVEIETHKEYRRRANVMKEYVWPKLLHELEAVDVVAFRNWLLENKSRDLARRTLSSFHSVLLEMHSHGKIKSDPAAGVTIRSTGRYEEDDGEVEIPTDDEVRAIYAAVDRLAEKGGYFPERWKRYRPMIYLAGFTGMRPSEYRGLAWSQLMSDHLKVTQRADRTGNIGPVKSRAGRRTIYLPMMLINMLKEWKKACPDGPKNLVFPTSSGLPVTLVNFRSAAWDPVMKEAGLVEPVEKNGQTVLVPKYTPYALRHYYASKLIESGRDLKFIQTTMGHSKIEVTFNVYGHLIRGREDHHRQSAEEFAQVLLGPQNSCGKSVAIPA
ncbi:tyrosine-type recombinase/integrase [Sinorhizobium meliloti]|uniref:tyrosine-type recombinase/integrase n=1 Tax=Rhizobium meliloti TaxID=382 RepID=UPI0005B350FE|nr:site-specific integrase [Sinorhizobium meliloti]MDE3767587.1 site-specific integrase [Sinorhizobium meliloti]MDE3779780.1 site-specific integrase [Sinorhizobium meliloti]MDE3807405.1 site-specific integrase [Sinorhizobium meliloti]